MVRTASEAIELLRSGRVSEVSFDHDLGDFADDGRETTGYDVLQFIEREVVLNGIEPPIMSAHSSNPPGHGRGLRRASRLSSGRLGNGRSPMTRGLHDTTSHLREAEGTSLRLGWTPQGVLVFEEQRERASAWARGQSGQEGKETMETSVTG